MNESRDNISCGSGAKTPRPRTHVTEKGTNEYRRTDTAAPMSRGIVAPPPTTEHAAGDKSVRGWSATTGAQRGASTASEEQYLQLPKHVYDGPCQFTEAIRQFRSEGRSAFSASASPLLGRPDERDVDGHGAWVARKSWFAEQTIIN